ncbi:hypothetical protein ACWD4G_04605 [Streptomyces sp. NPDC002643]
MSFSAVRFVLRSLTALLLSITVGWAPMASGAALQEGITLTPSEGERGKRVVVGFNRCDPPSYVIDEITWDDDPIDFTPSRKGGAVIHVPATARGGPHEVRATCVKESTSSVDETVFSGSATFTVTPIHDPRQDIRLTPADGPAGKTVTVEGIGFVCSAVNVFWDDGSTLVPGATPSGEGDITEKFDVPEGSSATAHTVRAECTDYPDYYATADFTVTETDTNGTTTTGDQNNGTTENGGNENGSTQNGGETGDNGTHTNGGTTGDTGGNGNGSGSGNGTVGGNGSGGVGGNGGDGSSAIPAGWVVGPSVFAALLLLALLYSLAHHRPRGPRWVRDHVRTTVRPGSGTAASELRERRDGRTVDLTVRLEPHPDPGDQSLNN